MHFIEVHGGTYNHPDASLPIVHNGLCSPLVVNNLARWKHVKAANGSFYPAPRTENR